MEIPYDTKANITTYLSVILVPILVGAGFTEATANIIIGIIALVLVGIVQVLNERWISKYFTKKNPDEVCYPINEPDSDGRGA